ncbi:MAG TPA: hypothetical protein VLU43_13505 [Anaeromyxobacteraceae bacterium]|nr:hypothetical protein [Anaeromyxobacteraceae bacterium]
MRSKPVPMLVVYRPRRGKERALHALLRRHGKALRAAGLAGDEPFRLLHCRGKRGGVFFVETFAWADATASDRAHEDPAVLAVWSPMEDLLEGMDIAYRGAEAITAAGRGAFRKATPARLGSRRRVRG